MLIVKQFHWQVIDGKCCRKGLNAVFLLNTKRRRNRIESTSLLIKSRPCSIPAKPEQWTSAHGLHSLTVRIKRATRNQTIRLSCRHSLVVSRSVGPTRETLIRAAFCCSAHPSKLNLRIGPIKWWYLSSRAGFSRFDLILVGMGIYSPIREPNFSISSFQVDPIIHAQMCAGYCFPHFKSSVIIQKSYLFQPLTSNGVRAKTFDPSLPQKPPVRGNRAANEHRFSPHHVGQTMNCLYPKTQRFTIQF